MNFLEYLDGMIEHMGVANRIEAANEICRHWDAFPKKTLEQAEAYLAEHLPK
jgi:hypothetical protein